MRHSKVSVLQLNRTLFNVLLQHIDQIHLDLSWLGRHFTIFRFSRCFAVVAVVMCLCISKSIAIDFQLPSKDDDTEHKDST